MREELSIDTQTVSETSSAHHSQPKLAPGVELIGQMAGTGFVEQPWLLRSDTGFVQLTELLYRIAEHLDGTRSPEDVAASVTETTRWSITGDQVRWLIDTKLAPLRLVAVRDSVQRSRASHRSPLQIRARWTLVGAERLAGIADVLRVLYAPALIVPLLLISIAALTWVHLVHGGLASVKVALYTPGALLVASGGYRVVRGLVSGRANPSIVCWTARRLRSSWNVPARCSRISP